MWDERYSEPGFAYGTEPNDFLAASTTLLPPKSNILCLGEGEGRNGVFLAAQGHRVTAVDSSAVGLAKARSLARERQVSIDTVETDLSDFVIEPERYEAIVSIFCHLPPPVRRQLHQQVCNSLGPGGIYILEGYSTEQFGRATGGPRKAEMLMDIGEIKEELNGLVFNHAAAIEREIHEGRYHDGIGSVIQIIATKPG
jgi:cyclopropane fatty-acyl-phospholipid synthase-like methyltransferase